MIARRNPPRLPTKKQIQRLVEEYARWMHYPRPDKRGEMLRQRYERALKPVLARLEATRLSQENLDALDAEARKWWNSRPFRGPGVDW